ncbi:MAG: nucleotidyltransferase domain-containing protein [Archaeoglobus sp.]|nr:nucleotidyltransferase domain-containing protein [Archaeoglobus sp.]
MQEPYSKVLEELLRASEKYFDLVSFVVYGSVARGDAKKDSDVDILLIAEGLPKDRYERFKLFDLAEREIDWLVKKLRKEGYNIFISPIIKSVDEAKHLSPLYLDMVEDAIIIFDRNSFFEKILERLRKRLKEFKARRIRMGRMWYWILKEDYRFGEVIEIE